MTKMEMFCSKTQTLCGSILRLSDQRSPDGFLRRVTCRWIQFFRFPNSKKPNQPLFIFSNWKFQLREECFCYLCMALKDKDFRDSTSTTECEVCLWKNEKREKLTETKIFFKKMQVLHKRWLKTCRVYREKQCALCWPGPLKVNYIFLYLEEGEVNTNLRSGYYGKSLTSTFDLLVWSGLNASLSPLSQIFGGRRRCFWRLKRSHALQPGGLSK